MSKKYIIAGIFGILAFAWSVSGVQETSAQALETGDVSQDGCVNAMDYDYMKTEFNKTLFTYEFDVTPIGNLDRKVNVKDLAHVMKDYNATCVPELLPYKPVGMIKLKMTHNNVTRFYQVYVPIGYWQNPTAYPLVMNYHGGTSDSTAQASLSLMNSNAQKNKYFAVYPDGVNNNWNDGRPHAIQMTNNADDVGFTEAMINKIDVQLNINRQKMYATGISNGGFMSFRMACERPDIFAAIAPVSSAFTTELNGSCNPSLPTPIAYFQGTSDTEILWNGGPISCNLCNIGNTVSVAATRDFWVSENNCSPTPTNSQLTNLESPDITQVTKSVYSGCTGGSAVEFYAISNGGHTWPGGIPYPPLGNTSQDVKATDAMYDFFFTKSR